MCMKVKEVEKVVSPVKITETCILCIHFLKHNFENEIFILLLSVCHFKEEKLFQAPRHHFSTVEMGLDL